MTEDKKVTEGAKALARRGASRGGNARAERLSSDDRSEIARRAAQARWGKTVTPASHVGDLRLAPGVKIACAVLEDGQRIINQGTMLAALGRARRPRGGDTGTVLIANNLLPYVSKALEETLDSPITYALPGGGRALGYPAAVLPEICEAYLSARDDDKLLKSQETAAVASDILIRSLARVGITALVDEATGYQEVRARDELQVILEAYVSAEFRKWMRAFPDDFFREMYRLQGWEFRPGTTKRTPQVGKLINKYIYEQLPPGVHEELRRLNPRNEKGFRPRKHHQHLTADTGHEHLDKQIMIVMTLMRISKSHDEFTELFQRAFPPKQPRLPFDLELFANEDADTA